MLLDGTRLQSSLTILFAVAVRAVVQSGTTLILPYTEVYVL